MLAGAVVGYPVAITYLLPDGARSYTDGERIYLAAHEGVEDRRLDLMVQGALICGRALGSKQLRAIVGRIELRQRYLVLEVERCCKAIEDRLPCFFLEQLAHYITGFSPQSPQESLAIARGMSRLPDPPAWYGTLQAWKALRKGMQGDVKGLTDTGLVQLEAKLNEIEGGDDDEDDDSLSKSSIWKFLSSPVGRDNFFSRFMQEILDMKSSPDKDAAESGIEGSSELVSGRISRHIRDITQAIRSNLPVSIHSSFVQSETHAHSYPEWDWAAKRYRMNWVSVEEVEPHSQTIHFEDGTLHGGGDRAFQRTLASLCLGLQRHRGQPQGNDLDLDRMIRLAVDLRSGHSGDDRVYSDPLRTRRDLGVEILLDASSSTLERSADGTRIFDLQVQFARRLCRALALLGDRVAMHGFHSWGRTLVRFQTLKTFDEPIGAELELRLQRLAVAGYTRCGAAIRHATGHLEVHSGTPFKLLVLISDGYPYDDQYEGKYAIEDTRKSIEEARAKGIACICISVGSDADAKQLEQVYGAANYLAINRAEQVTTRLRRLIDNAIGATTRGTSGARKTYAPSP